MMRFEWNDEKTCSSFKPLIINGLGKTRQKVTEQKNVPDLNNEFIEFSE